MRRSDAYILDEIVPPFLLGAASILMMLVGNTLYAFLDTMLKNNWPLLFVTRLLVFNIPVVLVPTIPVAVALASSLAVNRMARDNEITAMRSAGLSLWRLFTPLFLFFLFCAVAGELISEKVVPWAFAQQNDTQQYLSNLPADPIKTGMAINTEKFTVIPTTLQRLPGSQQIHLELRDTFLIDRYPKPGKYPDIWRVNRMEYRDGSWTLDKVTAYRLDDKGTLNLNMAARTLTLEEQLNLGQGLLSGIPEDIRLKQMSFQSLTRERDTALRFRQEDRALLLDVTRWFKLALPVMAIPFGICGIALALRFSRTGAFTGVLLSMGIVVAGVAVYFGMQALALTMAGKIPALPAALFAPLFFTALGMFLLKKQE